MAARTHFVYRVWDSLGTLLYIGCTKDPSRRWTQHKSDKSLWVPYAHSFKLFGPFEKAEAFARENAAIEDERPAFNALREHKRSLNQNYHRRQSLTRAARVRQPELFECDYHSPEWDEYEALMRRIERQAQDEVPAIGAVERHNAYLAARGSRHLAVVS